MTNSPLSTPNGDPQNLSNPANLLQSLQQIQDADDTADPKRIIPPLEKWQPKFCGEMDILVKANGEWWHEGRKVTRQSLVDLFAKVLWAEIDDHHQVTYYLKTPVEKIKIQVEDAPLLITQVNQIEQNGNSYIEFSTSQGDKFVLDANHPLRFGLPFHQSEPNTSQNVQSIDQSQQPYVLVRKNGDSQLYGLIHRNVFYHLVDMGELIEQQGSTVLQLNSGGQVFELRL